MCDISSTGSVRDGDSITVFDTCNGSHLFFLSEFEKRKKKENSLLYSEVLAESALGPLSVSVHVLHTKTHSMRVIHYSPESKWFLLGHAACRWYTDFVNLIKYLPGGITAKQRLRPETLPTLAFA